MKTLLVYSSKTGGTKKVADVINERFQATDYVDVVDAKNLNLDSYDLLIVGGWIDKGTMNKEVLEFMNKIKDKKIAFFFTLGAYPTSMHAYHCIERIKTTFEKNNNKCLGHFHCQGAVDPKLIEWMKNNFPSDHPHGPNEDRLNRWEDAAKHPNQEDFNAAKNFVSLLLASNTEENKA